MADATASFTVTLDGRQLVMSAEQGKSALEQLGKAIKDDQGEARALKKAMDDMQKSGVVDINVFRELSSKLEAKQRAIGQNTTAYVGLGGKVTDLAKKTKTARDRFAEITKSAQGMPGPFGAVASVLQRVGNLLGAGGARLLGMAAVVGLVTAAVIKHTKALYDYGVAQAESIRNEQIMLQNVTTVRNYWGIAAGKASDLSGAIDKVSASSSLSRGKLTDMAKSLYQAGFRGQNLADTLEGFATKSAVQGDEQAQIWLGYARSVALAGGSVKKMSDTVKAELGGQVQAQMLSSEVQAEKLKESYGALFGGLKLDKLLKAKKEFNDLFAQSESSGRALKQLLTVVLQPLVVAQAKALPVLKRFFQGMILAAQDFIIVVLDIAIWVQDTFGLKAPKSLDLTKAAVTAGKAAFWLLGLVMLGVGVLTVGLSVSLTKKLVPALWSTVKATWGLASDGLKNIAKFGKGLALLALEGVKQVGKLIASFATLAVQVLLATWPILLAGAALWGLYKIGELIYTVWREVDWKDLGSAIWKGIVNGISAGWQATKDAVSKLGLAAKNTLKELLGIHSPSKVFEDLGSSIGEGLKVGIDSSQPEVNQTVKHLVEVPKAESTGAGGTSKSVTFNFGDINIGTSGKDQAASSMVAAIMTELEKRLTEAALEMGVAV